ncbi:MAG: hypothetical protein AB1941_24230 [Gemmatimonadota bacterium]
MLLLVVAGCGPVRVRQGADRSGGIGTGGVAAPCHVDEISRQPLILEGGQVAYVEPTVLRASASGDVLLAGRHNYRFEKSGEGTWSRVRGDSLLGAVVTRAGPVRPIFAPFPTGQLNGVRAVGLGAGRWAVVFAEVPPVGPGSPSGGEMRPDSALRLWYGVVDGGKWTTLEPMPMPAGGKLEPASASSLVRYGETLAWAMVLAPPMERSRIILYEFENGRWSYEEVPAAGTEVELAHSDSSDLLLAVVQPDPRLRSDSNSLLLWARQPAWRILRSVVPGSRERVFHPSLRFTPAGAVLGWIASVPRPDGSETMEMHAMVGNITERDEPVMVLDTDVGPFDSPIALDMPGTSPLWIVDHRGEGSGAREIRFLRTDGAVPVVVGSIPNPYITHFAAQSLSGSELLISGGVLDSAEEFVGSLLIRARVVCGSE